MCGPVARTELRLVASSPLHTDPRNLPFLKRFARSAVMAAWLVGLCLAGCLRVPPPTKTACKLDSECATGRCLAGLCIEEVPDITDVSGTTDATNDLAGTDAVNADVDTTGKPTCAVDDDCRNVYGILPPCRTAVCDKGVGTCTVAPLAEDATCVTDTICPTSGTCKLGECSASPKSKPCDDGNACTLDTCTPNGCLWVAFADATSCDSDNLPCTTGACLDGKCEMTVTAGNCLIDGECEVGGVASSTEPCARCLPDQNAMAWTQVYAGPCVDGDACTENESCDEAGMCHGTPVVCSDDDPCLTPSCAPNVGCVTSPSPGPCDDGNPCTQGDTCSDGTCTPGAPVGCDDGNSCTLDVCQVQQGCTHTPDSGSCLADADPCTEDMCMGGACIAVPLTSVCKIAGTCVPAGVKADANACLICNPARDPTGWTPLENVPCSDGNACTFVDVCLGGKCVGEQGQCDDKNPCTKNTCTPELGCQFTSAAGPCDDQNLCTIGDQCVAGKCAGVALGLLDCDDDNPCTDDACLAAAGCTHTPNNALCDDGKVCTSGDHCNAAKCMSDQVVCACADTEDCDDGNACTLDQCVTDQGCEHVKQVLATCDDADACTSGDVCAVDGGCRGTKVDCADGNPCTIESCSSTIGCVALLVPGTPCNDGNACTFGDLCIGGQCNGTAKTCDDGNECTIDLCDPKTGGCQHEDAVGAPCQDDEIACTIDQCAGGACKHTGISPGSCLIGGACLADGLPHPADPCLACQSEVKNTGWSQRVGLPCNDGNACTVMDLCLSDGKCKGSELVCDDQNACTFNGCNPLAAEQPCLFVPVTGACNDGDACTGSDACLGESCVGQPLTCGDDNPCTVDACDKKTGCSWTKQADGSACPSDGFDCTEDACMTGACLHTVQPASCLIDNMCQVPGQSSAELPCLGCLPQVSQTEWSVLKGTPCDDGDPCTTADACSGGACIGVLGNVCDDSNPCTADTCSSKTGCSHEPIAAACDDGNACTVEDACAAGKCLGGKVKVCDPAAATGCTTPQCDPQLGCIPVSTCPAMHECIDNLCLTVTQPGVAGAALVPFDPTLAPQPQAPSLRWQPAGSGDTLPRLVITAQTKACSPDQGVFSGVCVASLDPVKGAPTFHYFQPKPPPEAQGWCATHPIVVAHPDQPSRLVAGWVEGGALASSCPLDATGGQTRLAVLDPATSALTVAPAAPCPTNLLSGLTSRPVVVLLPGFGADPADPTGLGGLLLRASPLGPLGWSGLATTTWGGPGTALPVAQLGDSVGVGTAARPMRVVWGAQQAVLTIVQHQSVGLDPQPTVEVVTFDAAGALAPKAVAVASGVAYAATEVAYQSLDAAWDSDGQALGILVAGTAKHQGVVKGFLAFALSHPSAPAPVQPAMLKLFTPPADLLGPPVLQAFRLAELPGTADFLVAWSMPASGQVQVVRVTPVADGTLLVKAIETVGTDFVSHALGPVVTNSGGLSDLVIDPSGTRFTLAWETDGGLRLLTAQVP